jgi:hypothetical protein
MMVDELEWCIAKYSQGTFMMNIHVLRGAWEALRSISFMITTT